MNTPASICILRLSALGDVLMIVPMVRTLQKSFPDVKLTWVISKPAYYLVEGMEGIEFIVIDKPKSLKDYLAFRNRMKSYRFDILLAAQASLRANLLVPFIRATRKIGYDKYRAKDGHRWFVNESIEPGCEHTLEGFLKFAYQAGADKQEVFWNMPVSDEDMHWAKRQIPKAEGPLVLINPAASKPERSWLSERYVDVINYLKEAWHARVILIGGPTDYDRQLAEDISNQVEPDANLVGKSHPKQLLALIQQSDLVLCPDTGPAHMASAMGTPVIAMHAVTNPNISAPYASRNLAINCYPEAVKRLLKMEPDEVKWGTQVHHPEAMKLASAQMVKTRINEVLSGLAFPSYSD